MGIGKFRSLALALIGSASLSACVYPYAEGYDGYSSYDEYAYGWDEYCDPYYDVNYYSDCDYGYGYGQIGFSGGYWDNYFYPGYGLWLFDRAGRRHEMTDRHRRYWGGKRHEFRQGRGDFGRNHRWAGLSEYERQQRRGNRQRGDGHEGWSGGGDHHQSGSYSGSGGYGDRQRGDGRRGDGYERGQRDGRIGGQRGERQGRGGGRRFDNGVEVTPAPQAPPIMTAPAPAQIEQRDRGRRFERPEMNTGDTPGQGRGRGFGGGRRNGGDGEAMPTERTERMERAQRFTPQAQSPQPETAPAPQRQRGGGGGFGERIMQRAQEARQEPVYQAPSPPSYSPPPPPPAPVAAPSQPQRIEAPVRVERSNDAGEP